MKTMSAYKARTNFGELLNTVYYGKEEIIIERKGKPMVKVSKVKPKETKNSESAFMKMAGVLSDKEADRMTKIYKEGRNDGSRKKKYLAKW